MAVADKVVGSPGETDKLVADERSAVDMHPAAAAGNKLAVGPFPLTAAECRLNYASSWTWHSVENW
jgi:hypothetical protein